MSSQSSPAGLRRGLRSLSPDQRRAFLADLYSARGFDVAPTEGGFVATSPPERLVVAVPGTGDLDEGPDAVLAVGSRVPMPTRDADARTARTLDAEAVDGMLRHAVDRERADALCRRHFDRSLAALGTGGRPVTGGVPTWLTLGRVGTALALLVVVAGVGLLLGPANPADTVGDAGPTAAGANVTPVEAGAATPGERTSADASTTAGYRGASLAPGLSSSGVTDVDDLAAAHADWLSGRSYRWELRYSEFENGTRIATFNETVVVESPTVYRTNATQTGSFRTPTPLSAPATYADGAHRYVWTGGLDRFAFERSRVDRRGDGRQAARAAAQLGRFLDVETSTVAGSTGVDGEARFFLTAAETDRPGVENYTVTALVDRNGVVRELVVRYDVPSEGVHVVYRFDYVDVGRATVEPPAWYPVARNATLEDGRFP